MRTLPWYVNIIQSNILLIGAAFKQECSTLYAANGVADLAVSGDVALAAGEYDRAIEIYSAAIDLDSATYTTFVNRSKARSEKMLWDDALRDAQKVRWHLLFCN
jgi:tetratricopeptide (TPR) repeat protein